MDPFSKVDELIKQLAEYASKSGKVWEGLVGIQSDLRRRNCTPEEAMALLAPYKSQMKHGR